MGASQSRTRNRKPIIHVPTKNVAKPKVPLQRTGNVYNDVPVETTKPIDIMSKREDNKLAMSMHSVASRQHGNREQFKGNLRQFKSGTILQQSGMDEQNGAYRNFVVNAPDLWRIE